MFQIRKATRSQAKMRIGLFGPSGSGKTYSALLLANGLVESLTKVVIIDTENGSADLYSNLGEYSVLPLQAPYEPKRYIDAIKYCENQGFELIIIDSITHEWDGPGGCLDIHSKLGGKFENWSKVTPLHQRFIEAIVSSKCHIITTGRSKVDYAFEGKKDGGRGKVEKIGLKTITREGFDYELTVAFQINQEHFCTIDKDRTDTFRDCSPFMISEETGKIIKDWNDRAPILKAIPVNEQNRVIELIMSKTDNGRDKDAVVACLDKLGILSSKEVKECLDVDVLRDWMIVLEQE